MLEGVYDDQNIFAKILRGEADAVRVRETEATLAFMDLFPQSEGHVLVIPKDARARNLLDAPQAVLERLFVEVRVVARGVVRALRPDGVAISQFNGAPAGQTVFHLHVHVIPRWADRPLAPHGGARMADRAALEATAARISQAIAAG